MCYGTGCIFERSDGGCGKSRTDLCPMDFDTDEEWEDAQNEREERRLMLCTHGHGENFDF